jgi:carbamoyl-phosphate synthase large subunit
LPAITITPNQLIEIRQATEKIAQGVNVRGLINIQYAISNGQLYVLEANPRASRTVPFVSKSTGIALAKAAARISVGEKIESLQNEGLLPKADVKPKAISVKEVVLPWNRCNTWPRDEIYRRSHGYCSNIRRKLCKKSDCCFWCFT